MFRHMSLIETYSEKRRGTYNKKHPINDNNKAECQI